MIDVMNDFRHVDGVQQYPEPIPNGVLPATIHR
jgi:hypothetical protein